MLKRMALARMVPIKLAKMRFACGERETRRGGMMGFETPVSTQMNAGKTIAAMTREAMTNGCDPGSCQRCLYRRSCVLTYMVECFHQSSTARLVSSE